MTTTCTDTTRCKRPSSDTMPRIGNQSVLSRAKPLLLVQLLLAMTLFLEKHPRVAILCRAQSSSSYSSSSSTLPNYGNPIRARLRKRPRWNPNPPPTPEDLEEQAQAFTNINHPWYDPNVFDDLLQDLTTTYYDGLTVMTDQFLPSPWWMWKQWSGTILPQSLRIAHASLLISFLICLLLRRITYGDWKVWCLPPYTTPIVVGLDPPLSTLGMTSVNLMALQVLDIVNVLWKTLQPLTTVLLVVFVGQAYQFWTSFYYSCRAMQSAVDDLWLLVTSNASLGRKNPKRQRRRRRRGGRGRGDTTTTIYTTSTECLLTNVLHHQLQLYHILFWAYATRRYHLLLTEPGMSRMVVLGIMKPHEKELLDLTCNQLSRSTSSSSSTVKPPKHWIILEWITKTLQEIMVEQQQAQEPIINLSTMFSSSCPSSSSSQRRKQRRFFVNNHNSHNYHSRGDLSRVPVPPPLSPSSGFDTLLLEKVCTIQRTCQHIVNQCPTSSSSMPYAYAHSIRIFVDVYVWMTPLAQYKECGIFAAVLTAMVTILYGGLLHLAFQLLNPLDDEFSSSSSSSSWLLLDDDDINDDMAYMDVSVLIRETTTRGQQWMATKSSQL